MRTNEALNRIIAEWCGWIRDPETGGWVVAPAGSPDEPCYCTDLNAMAEAEDSMSSDQRTDYIRILNQGDFSYRRLAFATARRRAEALVKVIESK